MVWTAPATRTPGEFVDDADHNLYRDNLLFLKALVFDDGTVAGATKSGRTSSNTTVNNSTTFVNVSGLSFTVGASETWTFQFHVYMISNVAADAKLTLTLPTTPTAVRYGVASNDPGVTTNKAATAGGTAIVFSTQGNDEFVVLAGILRNGASSGTVQLQFAQNTAHVSNSIVYLDSYFEAQRIS